MKISEIVNLAAKMEDTLKSKTILKYKFVYAVRKNLITAKPFVDDLQEIQKDLQGQIQLVPEKDRAEKIAEANKVIADHVNQDAPFEVFCVAAEFLPQEAEGFILDVAYTLASPEKTDK